MSFTHEEDDQPGNGAGSCCGAQNMGQCSCAPGCKCNCANCRC
jgi:hypothetical protein